MVDLSMVRFSSPSKTKTLKPAAYMRSAGDAAYPHCLFSYMGKLLREVFPGNIGRSLFTHSTILAPWSLDCRGSSPSERHASRAHVNELLRGNFRTAIGKGRRSEHY